ncbi:MAG: hypothetical protein AAGD00_07105 [Planctomycetota bacterium]
MSAAAPDASDARAMQPDNITLPAGAGKTASRFLLGLGLVFIAVNFFGGFAAEGGRDMALSLYTYNTGFIGALGFSLGALCFVMILHALNAGWTATIRRQFENVMALMWVAGGLFFLLIVMQVAYLLLYDGGGESAKYAPYLWKWMNPAYVEGDALYTHKQPFLNVPFFGVRAVLYFVTWLGLAAALWKFSRSQDESGDRWQTAHARKLSCIGLPIFAFSIAFAGFDWVMTLDFHWFSTMLGVWLFAGSMLSALALTTLTLQVLKLGGRMHKVFTTEHLHDLGKLVFAFTVFWAYIAFSQYFLIWYAGIPEETMFFIKRKEGVWEFFSILIPVAHFIIPFLLIIARPARRLGILMGVMCVWLLLIHFVELWWMIRPEATSEGYLDWRDIVGPLGPIMVFLGVLVSKVASGPLVPLQDPRLVEGLHHKNYV